MVMVGGSGSDISRRVVVLVVCDQLNCYTS